MIKQVLIMRHDLKCRKGKLIVQGAHAAIGSLNETQVKDIRQWEELGCTKICVYVDGELELKSMYQKALDAGLPCYLVLDAGRTEFKEPTYTACAIGPAVSEEIDKITGNLPLL